MLAKSRPVLIDELVDRLPQEPKMFKNEDRIVLSYHDSLLRDSDVQLLRGPHWINDTIIGFYFEHLDKAASNSKNKDLLFVSPELTQLLKLTASSDYEMLLEPIDAKSKSFLFFPLNNCDSRETAGGTHWSLLVYSKSEETCFHIDSSKGLNSVVAKSFAKSILDYFCGKGLENYLEIDTPQQDNGYDCGLYVLCATDLIASYTVAEGKVENCGFESLKILVDEKRKKLLELIDCLKNIEAEADR